MSERLRSVASRLGLTEGQAYTVVIVAVVATLLTSGLARLDDRDAGLAGAPVPAPAAARPADAPAAPSEPPPGTSAPRVAPPGAAPLPPGTSPAAGPVGGMPATGPLPTSPLAPGDGRANPVCPGDAAVDGARDLMATVDPLLGGVVPDGTVVSVVALVTGCSQADPTVLLLAALIEMGKSLPNLGLDWLELPPLPFVPVPADLIELAQPLRPILDPLCNTVGTVGLLFSQVGPHYPAPIDAAFALSLFYATATCGQIQDPS